MKIKIDKGVELPTRGGANKNFPFDEMEVGDSFFLHEEKRVRRISSVDGRGQKKSQIQDCKRRCWRSRLADLLAQPKLMKKHEH